MISGSIYNCHHVVIHIDNYCNSLLKDRIYCAWNDDQILYSNYSSNGGLNWQQPQVVAGNLNHFIGGPNIITNNYGAVYISIAEYFDQTSWNQMAIFNSVNGGSNWSPLAEVVTYNNFYANIFTSGLGPSICVNMQDNSLYLVYSAAGDVYLKKSTDYGYNWYDAGIVNQINTGAQSFPWISCDPMSGYLACIYFDNRWPVGRYTYVSLSTNFGNSWCDMKVSNQFWHPQSYQTYNGYIGIDFNKGIIYPVWYDKRFSDNKFRTYIYPYNVIERDLEIHDQTFNDTRLFQSANTIFSYNITLNSGANIKFRSVNSITLEHEFITNDNSVFIAELFNCPNSTFGSKDNIIYFENLSKFQTQNIKNIPDNFKLYQNYPNPFNPSTSINYDLKKDTEVKIEIYNILGKKVKTLLNEYQNAGRRSIVWDGTNDNQNFVSSGIYIYKIVAGIFIESKKMLLIR